MANYKIGSNLWGSDNGNYYEFNKQHKWTMVNSSPYSADQTRINAMYGAQQKAQLGALQQQQADAMRGYNQTKKNNAVTYQGQRNAADVTNAQNVQAMREAMAANGIQASGENITAQAGLAGQRQSALSGITAQQNQANQDAYNQIADIMSPSQKQAILNNISAQKAQSLHDSYTNYLNRLDQQHANYQNQFNANRQFDYTKSQDNRNYDYTKSQNDANMAYQYWLAKQNLAQNSGANGSDFQNSGGGGGTSSFNANLAAANKRGLSKADNAALSWIVQHESSYNPNAKNPKSSAYGYGQFLTATQKAYEKKMGLDYSNPVDQLLMTEQYMKDRYGSAANAVAFWKKHNWY
jgi:hypothetical protein